MSRFYGEMHNERSAITKCGHKDGLTAHIRGWNAGIRVECYVDQEGNDQFMVWSTGGSNQPGNNDLLAEVTDDQK